MAVKAHWLMMLFVAVVWPGAVNAAEPRIEYIVDLGQAQTQVATISMVVKSWDADTLDVHLPAWRPGKYMILDTAGTIRRTWAADGAGQPLKVEKTAKASWRVQTRGADSVRVSYEIYANSLGDRTRHIDDTHAFLSGSTVFMFANELRAEPLHVRVEGRPEWRVTTGLEFDADSPGAIVAPNYDALVDSPFEIGRHDLHSFDVDGVSHELAIWGDAGGREEDLIRDIARIAHAQKELFGGFPYTRYTVILHIAPGIGGGTEHVNSTIVQVKPTVFDTPKTYRGLLSLLCHEIFHTWNVKQFRPTGIKPYDYSRENYTKLLWVAEGTTSYYDMLLLVRAGLIEPKHYFEELATLVKGETTRPGAQVQSVEDSSFDAWIKFNKPSPDSVNSTVSFYDKGALVSFVLDVEIRKRTANEKSLDSLMAELYLRFPLSGPGYGTEDLHACLQDLTQADFRPFFADFIAGTKPLPLDEALAAVGLEVFREPDKDAGQGESELYIGLTLKDADGAAVVSAVLADGPAFAAGVIADDQIMAMNGTRLRAADLESRLKHLEPGAPVRLTLFRRDEMREVEFAPMARRAGAWKVRRIETATPEQRAMHEKWLGQPWPESKNTKKEENADAGE